MNITEHEMRGLLTGKCLPGDMLVNEELPAYLVRKFAELKGPHDAHKQDVITWEKSMMAAIGEDGVGSVTKAIAELKAQCDALAAENVALKSAINYVCDTDNQPDYQYDGMGCGIEDRGIVDRYEAARYGWDEAIERIYSEVISFSEDTETPVTDAYLNSVRAGAVESFAHQQRVIADAAIGESQRKHRIAAGFAEDFAAQLRTGKDGK